MTREVINMTGRGARGESFADVLRRTGAYGVLSTDTDAQAVEKVTAQSTSAIQQLLATGYAPIPRVGIEGDSIMARNHSPTFGSTGAMTQGVGELAWARAIFPYFEMDQWNDPTDLVNFSSGMNTAVSGNTSADVLARVDTVSDLAADIMCIAVGVNDINNGVAEATTLANVEAICRYYTGFGKTVLLGNIRPVAASYHAEWADGGVRTLKRISLNASLAAFAETEPNVALVDFDPWLGDGASPVRPLAGTIASGDAPHLSRYGGWLGGQAWAAALRKVIKPLVEGVPTGTSILSGSDFTGTGGAASTGVSGSVATGWAIARNLGSATAVASKDANDDQVLTITPGGATNEQIQIGRVSGGVTIEEGKWYKSYARITLAASNYWRGVMWTPYSGSFQAMGDTLTGASLPLSGDTQFVIETPVFQGPSGGTSGTVLLRIMIDGASPSPMIATIHEVKVVEVPDPRPLHGL